MEHVYLRPRDPDQPFWAFARERPESVRHTLTVLASRPQRLPVSREEARRVLDTLHTLGFREDEAPNLRTPIEVVDFDGQPVAV